jgi:hypothetical protein
MAINDAIQRTFTLRRHKAGCGREAEEGGGKVLSAGVFTRIFVGVKGNFWQKLLR